MSFKAFMIALSIALLVVVVTVEMPDSPPRKEHKPPDRLFDGEESAASGPALPRAEPGSADGNTPTRRSSHSASGLYTIAAVFAVGFEMALVWGGLAWWIARDAIHLENRKQDIIQMVETLRTKIEEEERQLYSQSKAQRSA